MRPGPLAFGLIAIASAWANGVSAADLPASIRAEGVPPIPPSLDREMNAYRFVHARTSFQGWLAGRREILTRQEVNGISQVFHRDEPGGEPTRLTSHPSPVAWAYPCPTRDRFVFASDNGGDENNHLFLFNIDTGSTRRFADGSWLNESPRWSRSGRQLALSSNARNGKDMDLYVVDPPYTATGRRLKEITGSLAASTWSHDDRRIAAVEISPDYTKTRVHLIDVETGRDEILADPPDHPRKVSGVEWSKDDRSLYWITDRDSEFDHLASYELVSGRETSLTAAIPWDIDEYDLSDDGSTIVFVANEEGRSTLHVLDAMTGEERPAPQFARGIMSSLSFRPRSHEFAFHWRSSRSPTGIYSYDLDSGQRTTWVQPRPVSPKAGSIAEPDLIRYPSFDGRMIPAFVRRPDRRFAGRRPVLIDIHGGPNSQARPEPSSFDGYLIDELGIAIIAPNVRGSTGYGKSFEKLDNGLLREDSVRDVGSLLDWIAAQPDLDASRVAVTGGSYGGYMSLAMLVRYGDRLRAGIDWMGVSDFEAFIKAARPGSVDAHRDEFGDERDPKIQEFFRRISPRWNAGEIRKPLMVIHGSNDPRVRAGESDRIVSEVRKNGTPVWNIRFDGEGHGIDRREHGIYFHQAQVIFLKRYLLDEGS